MKFDIKVWLKYRNDVQNIGDKLNLFKDENNRVDLDNIDVQAYLMQITLILKKCSFYLTQCGIPFPLKMLNDKFKNPNV